MNKVDKVFQGWLHLTSTERQDLLKRLQRDLELRDQGIHTEHVKKGFDLGPISQAHCPCCGK